VPWVDFCSFCEMQEQEGFCLFYLKLSLWSLPDPVLPHLVYMPPVYQRATIKDFYGALKEDNSREPMVFELDEPPVLLGKNKGANPVEYLLGALSGCLTTSLIAHASARGLRSKG
jgi:hypothetical protein